MNQDTTLDVTGMTCENCVRHVNKALRKIDGVSDVEVHLDRGKVRVSHDPDRATVPAMIEALKKAGYESRAPG